MLHRRLWASRLWILAALLGAASVALTASIIHDTGRLRATARSMAESTAGQLAALAASRLEVFSLETFAPVTPWDVGPAPDGRAALVALLAAQDAAQRCHCRDTLAALEFFRLNLATGALDIASRGAPRSDALSREIIERTARAAAARATSPRLSSVHLTAGPPLSAEAAVTLVQRNATGNPAVVYGLVGDARWIVAALFEHGGSSINGHSFAGLPTLDTLSVQVATTDSVPVLGVLGAGRQIRGTVAPHGSLEGLTVTVALSSVQIPMSMFISHNELWHVGILLIATVLVIGFAVGSSRRELLLARARSDFIAGVSHDLRMPLAQILIAGETLALQRDRDAVERLALSSSIVREARRLVGLIDNVMLFSRSGSVTLRAIRSSVSAQELFEDVVDAVRLAVDDARQSIEFQPTELALDTDRQLMRQALVNLVDNALKYGVPGQRIRLGVERSSAGRARVYVEDEGPGIPVADRARVFDAYERLGRDQTSERTGTGLGLAVVKHIVTACGGRVWLDAGHTAGTRAVIELPLSDVREPAPEPALA